MLRVPLDINLMLWWSSSIEGLCWQNSLLPMSLCSKLTGAGSEEFSKEAKNNDPMSLKQAPLPECEFRKQRSPLWLGCWSVEKQMRRVSPPTVINANEKVLNIASTEITCQPGTIEHGYRRSPNRVYKENEVLQFACDSGYKYVERSDARCTQNGWYPKPACTGLYFSHF